MKPFASLLLAIILTFTVVLGASAQSAETIWLVATGTSYKTGETIIVTVNAASATPIQGFTFQIRYDPACLQPTNATSPVPGMNGLQLPQLPGLVDASYASTTPQTVSGVLAEVRFVTLGGCQTNLTLESAALAIRNEQGFAAPLPGVTIGEKTIALTIDKERGTSNIPPVSGTPLILGEVPTSGSSIPAWLIILLSILLGGGGMFWVFKLLRKGTDPASKKSKPSPSKSAPIAKVQIQRGSQAGRNFSLNKLPCNIGSDPVNEICLDDPFISNRHAKIFATNSGYFLMGLAGETFVNGMPIRKTAAVLQTGDTVRLGKNVFFTFVI